MLTWPEFAHALPDLAEAGRRLLYQFGVGLGFLAAIRSRFPAIPATTLDEALRRQPPLRVPR